MTLTIKAIDTLKPREKEYKKADSQGLFIFVTPKGKKYWRFRYVLVGKEGQIRLGEYLFYIFEKGKGKKG